MVDAFRELKLLTLPCLYVLEVVSYCWTKCTVIQGRDIHQYGTRGRGQLASTTPKMHQTNR
ncbi:hypothetical protein J6590_056419 [Homalodisca vitripennis]|nr:hypothetical protein J6590_056419 [Homalodisca vitripennis]